MRRTAVLAVAIVALFAFSTIAAARGGHNPPTKKLERAFKVALLERVQSEDGCYPPPAALAAEIRHEARLEVDLAADFDSIDEANIVHVIRRRARCGRVRMALRAEAGLYVLNSARGPVYVKGRSGELSREERAAGRGPVRALTLTTDIATLTRADEKKRITIRCPRGRFPLGGGMVAAPPPAPDGEGVYPHSYERLGAQRGFHVTAVLVDPSPAITAPREVTIQVVCGLGLVPTDSPRRTVFTMPGETKSVVARCPPRSHLFSGGFQRTNFTTPSTTAGGNFVTESRAIGPRSWRVTGHAIGSDGGELTAIAHCAKTRRPPLVEVGGTSPLPGGEAAAATTPPCPQGRRLVAGGFSLNGSVNAFFAGGSINRDGTWSATGFGYLGPSPGGLTAYGYCLRAR
jgi:hypothetical protein